MSLETNLIGRILDSEPTLKGNDGSTVSLQIIQRTIIKTRKDQAKMSYRLLTPGLDNTCLFMSLTAGAGTRCMSLPFPQAIGHLLLLFLVVDQLFLDFKNIWDTTIKGREVSSRPVANNLAEHTRGTVRRTLLSRKLGIGVQKVIIEKQTYNSPVQQILELMDKEIGAG